jgi:hypothetical protein
MRLALFGLVALVLTVPLVACEGEVIDGGTSTSATQGTSSSRPEDLPNSFFGRWTASTLYTTNATNGPEEDPAIVGITSKIVLSEAGTYAYEDGSRCTRGTYTYSGGGFVFTPPLGAGGAADSHGAEFRNAELFVRDLIPKYPWVKLRRSQSAHLCDTSP